MATRIRLLHDHGIRWGDWLDTLGAWLVAGLFWLVGSVAAALVGCCTLLTILRLF